VVVQARKILTRHVYAMIDQGENDEHRLTVGGLVRLRSIERDHAIKSASDSRKI
jgi:cytochrome c-type biogenesis protein CcmE